MDCDGPPVGYSECPATENGWNNPEQGETIMKLEGLLVVSALLCLEMGAACADVATDWTSFAGGKS